MTSTYGEVVEALRDLHGSRILAQMRSSAGGDHLTARGVLGEPSLFADQAMRIAVGDNVAEFILHFDQATEAHVSEDGVLVFYGSGAQFRCVRESSAIGPPGAADEETHQ